VILLLRALGVGDLAASVPALRAIRAAFPARTLALAAPSWLTPLIDLVGGVDRVVPTAGLAQPPDVEAPEVAVNLHGRGPESHRLLQSLEPAKLWAFASPAAGHLDGPGWAEEEHEVQRWCRLLRWYGLEPDPSDLSLAVPSVDVARKVTIIHPGATLSSFTTRHGRMNAGTGATPDDYVMAGEAVAKVAVLMAALPPQVNLFETTILPNHMRSFIGRG